MGKKPGGIFMSELSDLRRLLKDYPDERDDKGRLIIRIRLGEDFPLYASLSDSRHPRLNPELYDYVEERTNLVPSSLSLHTIFEGRVFTDKEKEDIRSCFHDHYLAERMDILWDRRAVTRAARGMAFLGTILLGLYFFLDSQQAPAVIMEILSIIGSFAIWEAAAHILEDRPGLLRKKAANTQYMEQVISFADEESAP
jgi:hypothetical protein